MLRIYDSAASPDILTEFSESGQPDTAAFAAMLNTSVETVEYWLELASVRRQLQDRATSD